MKIFLFVSIILAVVTLAVGFAIAGFWPVSIGAILMGLLWFLAQWRSWPRIINLCIVTFLGIAAAGGWIYVTVGWLLVGVVATLMAWDSGNFLIRLEQAEYVRHRAKLEKAHGQRLVIIAGIALLLGGVALNIQLSLNIWWGIFWSIVAIFGLSQIVRRLRRETE